MLRGWSDALAVRRERDRGRPRLASKVHYVFHYPPCRNVGTSFTPTRISRIKSPIREHAKRRHLDYLFEEIIVPTENLLDVRHGQKHATERRFSPSCALAKMGLTDEAYHLIKNSQRSPLRWLPQKAELEFNRRRSSYTARGDHRRLRLRVDSQSSVFRLSSPDL